ncbi:MAG TPA: hypothetical protein VNE16_01240 [Vicinamibacterales bacterium]|nr:hypothetical protein [Vicinamibacterales bacterium]
MKSRLWVAVAFASALSLTAAYGNAQNQTHRKHVKPVSATGCLTKGDERGEVWLEKKDGTIYGLESTTINLSAHLGHTVTVTGYVLPEGKEEAGEQEKGPGGTGKHETADFRVLTLKMVSRTCQQ